MQQYLINRVVINVPIYGRYHSLSPVNVLYSRFIITEIMNRLKLFVATASLVLVMGSCGVPKDVTYFQGIDSLTPEQVEMMNQTYTTRIVPDDLLTITVTAWDPTVVTPFNPPVYAYAAQGETSTVSSTQLQTYLVDKEGNINFPVLGKVHVAGLTKMEMSNMLQEKISHYVSDALVNVQIVNYKVTLVGEVSKPGAISVKNDRISILDAIGQAGDLTINANRTNVLVIRDNNGEKEFARMDLTKPDIFTSPFYYLRQNDVVYVEHNKAKKRNSRYSQAQSYNVTIISTVLTAVSVISTVAMSIVTATK